METVKKRATKSKLIDEVIALVNNAQKQEELVNNIARFAIPHAAELIVDEVMQLIKNKNQ